MLFQFQNFTFDNKRLVLQKGGVDVDIRPYEAKLLAYLLDNQDKVVSKQDILAYVWQDKVVAEQVIFQNISHLRALFGSESIKTFPKRGYQWQFKATPLLIENNAGLDVSPIQQAAPANFFNKWVGGVAVFTVTVLFALLFILVDEEQKTIRAALIPFKQDSTYLADDIIDQAVIRHDVLTDIDADSFITSAELMFTRFNQQFDTLITGEVREFAGKYYLDFIVKGQAASWQGQIQANSTLRIAEKLNAHLSNKVMFELTTNALSPGSRLAMLTLAHENAPSDLIILARLIEQLISARELDKAMVLLEKLATNAIKYDNQQQLGIAYILQSEILTNKEVYSLSREKLAMANDALKSVNDLKRQADLWEAQSWLDHQARDYEKIKESLLISAGLGLQANDKKRELHAITYLSVMAHKYGKTEDKYAFIREAEARTKEYNLPLYHFAKVPFHYAIFAKTSEEKEPHYKTVLEYTALIPDFWVAQVSRERLLLRYLATQRLNEARELVSNLQSDNAHNNYLRMLLANVDRDIALFASIGQKAFEQAQFAGKKRLSLDIALLLCDALEVQENFAFYSQYIRENASKGWQNANEEKLTALNITIEEGH
jgi:DNA-binding winged helix-turn-helix (wHTH) protein